MSELKWGIKIVVPVLRKGKPHGHKTREVIATDRYGSLIFNSQAKAMDYLDKDAKPQIKTAYPRVCRIKVTVTLPK